jgi:hypothetical protein
MPPETPDRRGLERRIGDRRRHLILVKTDRRRGGDRRQRIDRREGADDHIRNALQILSAFPTGEGSPEGFAILRQALRQRLEAALAEVDRMDASRRHIGELLRERERIRTSSAGA